MWAGSTRDELAASWLTFKQTWYEDQTTHYYFRDFDGGWRIAVTPDKEEPEKFCWSIFNHVKKTGDQRAPFTTRLAAARNVFAHLMVWEEKSTPEVAAAWLQEMAFLESGQLRQAEIVN